MAISYLVGTWDERVCGMMGRHDGRLRERERGRRNDAAEMANGGVGLSVCAAKLTRSNIA